MSACPRSGTLPLTTRNNDDNEQDDDAHNQADTHLHVLPPHILPELIRSAVERARIVGESFALVLEPIQSLSTLRQRLQVLLEGLLSLVDSLYDD